MHARDVFVQDSKTIEALQFLEDFVKTGKEKLNNSDWEHVSKTISSLVRGSWEVICMKYFNEHSDLQSGHSLITYLESNGIKINRFAMAHFISLLGKTSNYKYEQEDTMKLYYDKFLEDNDILDSISIEVSVIFISKNTIS